MPDIPKKMTQLGQDEQIQLFNNFDQAYQSKYSTLTLGEGQFIDDADNNQYVLELSNDIWEPNLNDSYGPTEVIYFSFIRETNTKPNLQMRVKNRPTYPVMISDEQGNHINLPENYITPNKMYMFKLCSRYVGCGGMDYHWHLIPIGGTNNDLVTVDELEEREEHYLYILERGGYLAWHLILGKMDGDDEVSTMKLYENGKAPYFIQADTINDPIGQELVAKFPKLDDDFIDDTIRDGSVFKIPYSAILKEGSNVFSIGDHINQNNQKNLMGLLADYQDVVGNIPDNQGRYTYRRFIKWFGHYPITIPSLEEPKDWNNEVSPNSEDFDHNLKMIFRQPLYGEGYDANDKSYALRFEVKNLNKDSILEFDGKWNYVDTDDYYFYAKVWQAGTCVSLYDENNNKIRDFEWEKLYEHSDGGTTEIYRAKFTEDMIGNYLVCNSGSYTFSTTESEAFQYIEHNKYKVLKIVDGAKISIDVND